MTGSKRSSQSRYVWVFPGWELQVGGEAPRGPAGRLPPLGPFPDATLSPVDGGHERTHARGPSGPATLEAVKE